VKSGVAGAVGPEKKNDLLAGEATLRIRRKGKGGMFPLEYGGSTVTFLSLMQSKKLPVVWLEGAGEAGNDRVLRKAM